MNTDTIFEKLIETGMKPEQAKLIAELQRDNDYIHYGELKYLATKEYIQKELKTTTTNIKNDIKDILHENYPNKEYLQKALKDTSTVIKNDIKQELKDHYATKNDVSKSTNKILLVLGSLIISIATIGISILGYLITNINQNTPNNKQQQTISRNH